MNNLESIKSIIATFANKNCVICNGTGKAGYVSQAGDKVLNVVCECAQKRYRKRMEKMVQEPCKECGKVREFCDHRHTRLIDYAMRKANEQRPNPKNSTDNTSPICTGMPTLS